jgi:hypothetical protein
MSLWRIQRKLATYLCVQEYMYPVVDVSMRYSPPSINVTQFINVNSLYLLTNHTPLILLTRMLTMLNVKINLLPSMLICHL